MWLTVPWDVRKIRGESGSNSPGPEKEKWGEKEGLVKQHHQLNDHNSEQTLGESESLECYGAWNC